MKRIMPYGKINNATSIFLIWTLGFFITLLFSNNMWGFIPGEFKNKQLSYNRVVNAFMEKEPLVNALLAQHNISLSEFDIYLRAFKFEEKLELWAKNRYDDKYKLIRVFDFCSTTGLLGPKRREGDGQIPEGIYYISNFNPVSNYHLSLKINYPNQSDVVLGHQPKLGGEIYLHGGCSTIGCIPLTDDGIKLLYVLAVRARDSGPQDIPVHIFPSKLSVENMKLLKQQDFPHAHFSLWNDLQKVYLSFQGSKTLPSIYIDAAGRYLIEKN